MGCVGSGKSSSCCVEILSRALRQKPYNGVRKSRWAVIRNTYPELKSTTIKTWETWFSSSVAPIKWDTPITSTMKIGDIGDGTALELEVVFLAMDRAEETGKLRSLELTGAWINEASKILLDKVLPNLGEMKVDMNTDGVMFNLNMSAPKVLTQGGDVIDVKEVVEVAESKVDW